MHPTRNPVGWFEIYVQDLERAKAFYEATFQVALQPLPSPPGLPVELLVFPADMTLPGCPGSLVKMEGKGSGPGGTIIYFSCADCAVEAARAAAHGGQILRDKFSIGDYGFITFVSDPEGNLIGLHSLQ